MNTFLFFRYGNRMLVFLLLLFSKRVQILKAEYKYGQYCTPSPNQIADIFSR